MHCKIFNDNTHYNDCPFIPSSHSIRDHDHFKSFNVPLSTVFFYSHWFIPKFNNTSKMLFLFSIGHQVFIPTWEIINAQWSIFILVYYSVRGLIARHITYQSRVFILMYIKQGSPIWSNYPHLKTLSLGISSLDSSQLEQNSPAGTIFLVIIYCIEAHL